MGVLTTLAGTAALQWIVTKSLDEGVVKLRQLIRRKLRPSTFAKAATAALNSDASMQALDLTVIVDKVYLEHDGVLEAVIDAAVLGEPNLFAERLRPAVTVEGAQLAEPDLMRLLASAAEAVTGLWVHQIASDPEIAHSVELTGHRYHADVSRWLMQAAQEAAAVLRVLNFELGQVHGLIDEQVNPKLDAILRNQQSILAVVEPDTQARHVGAIRVDDATAGSFCAGSHVMRMRRASDFGKRCGTRS